MTRNPADSQLSTEGERDPSGIRTRVPPAPNLPTSPGFSPDLNTRTAPSPVPLPICSRERGHATDDLTGVPGSHSDWDNVRPLSECCGASFPPARPDAKWCQTCGAAPGTPCDPAQHTAHAPEAKRPLRCDRCPKFLPPALRKCTRPANHHGDCALTPEPGWAVTSATSLLWVGDGTPVLAPPVPPRDAVFSSELHQARFSEHVTNCSNCWHARDAGELCAKGRAIWDAVTAAPPPTPTEHDGPKVRVLVVNSTQVRGALSLRAEVGGGFSALASALHAAGFAPGDVLELRKVPR